jgi:hypothetical protein
MTALALVLGLLTSACDGLGPGGSADCGTQIKVGDTVFSSYGYTNRDATEHGVALESVCEDVGADARGAVFTDESRRVTTFRFEGYPATEVLGVRFGDQPKLAVFVADSVSPDDQDRIYRELAPAKH